MTLPMPYPFANPMQGGQNFFNPLNRVAAAPPLYVGNLDENIHEETLYEFFSKFGPLHFVRIMRDQTSGKSRGFGFVNFLYPRDAEVARQFAQNEKLGRKHIRILFKRNVRDLPPEANLFVKNLDPNVTVKEIQTLFSSVAPVISAHIASSQDGKNLGYGYVQFEKAEDAKKALDSLQNHKLKENEIQISPYVPKDRRGETVPKRNLYVKNLPENKNEGDLEKFVKEFFGKYGEIETFMIKKKAGDDAKFSAFICFKDQNSAQKAFDDINTNKPTLPGSSEPVYINWHQDKRERERELKSQHQHSQNETNLFVKNLDLNVTENDLKIAFSTFGQITSVAIKDWTSNDTQKKARMGFVNFKNVEDARKASTESPNNDEIGKLFIGGKAYVGVHQPKDKRKEYLLSQKKWKAQQANAAKMFSGFQGMPQFPEQRRFPPFPGQMGGRPMFPQQFQKPTQRDGAKQHRGPWGGAGGPVPQRGGRPFNKGHHQGNRPPMDQQQVPSHIKQTPNQNAGKPLGPGPKAPTQTQQQAQTTPGGGITVQNLRTRLQEFLSLEELKQRQILGELLFPLVLNIAGGELAPKITGMLIDLSVLEVQEILEFLESPELLTERVHEAVELIQNESA